MPSMFRKTLTYASNFVFKTGVSGLEDFAILDFKVENEGAGGAHDLRGVAAGHADNPATRRTPFTRIGKIKF